VVKNVTGYDLGKLYTGSRGALVVILAAWLRLRPRPERVESLRIETLPDTSACEKGVEIARRVTARACSLIEAEKGWSAVVELAGDEASVDRDRDWLERELGARAAAPDATDAIARRRWASAAEPRIRFSVSSRSSRLGACATSLREAGADLLVLPGLPLIVAEFDGTDVASAFDRARSAAALAAGRICCESAPTRAKQGRDVFDAPDAEVRLARQLKSRFDPAGTLNRGRFAGRV
jgi:glycolate oxidase FAD binding subunit